MAYDPICGSKLAPQEDTPQSEHRKRKYYFCSERCREEFDKTALRIRLKEAAAAGVLLDSNGKVKWGKA